MVIFRIELVLDDSNGHVVPRAYHVGLTICQTETNYTRDYR